MKTRIRSIEKRIHPSHSDVILRITGLPTGDQQHCYINGEYFVEIGDEIQDYPANEVIDIAK